MGPAITAFADRRATYLVVGADGLAPAGTVLRVELGTGTVVEVSVGNAGAQFTSAAAFAFSEITGWSAQVVAPGGQVLASASG
jgi:hypothetical protein